MKFKRILFFSLIFLIIAWFYTPGFLKLRKFALSLRHCEREIEELKRKNRESKKEICLLKNDPFIIEKLGREELGLVKEGEIVYKIR